MQAMVEEVRRVFGGTREVQIRVFWKLLLVSSMSLSGPCSYSHSCVLPHTRTPTCEYQYLHSVCTEVPVKVH